MKEKRLSAVCLLHYNCEERSRGLRAQAGSKEQEPRLKWEMVEPKSLAASCSHKSAQLF